MCALSPGRWIFRDTRCVSPCVSPQIADVPDFEPIGLYVFVAWNVAWAVTCGAKCCLYLSVFNDGWEGMFSLPRGVPWRFQRKLYLYLYMYISFCLSLVLGQAERNTSNTKSVGLNPDFVPVCCIFLSPQRGRAASDRHCARRGASAAVVDFLVTVPAAAAVVIVAVVGKGGVGDGGGDSGSGW